jgi:transitional endoplasmic reticulum ATPase
MKPKFISQMEEAFAVQQHVILTLNTEDRFYFPEKNIGPMNLNYFVSSYFSGQGYRIAQYSPSMGVRELSPSGNTSLVFEELSSQTDPVEILNRLSSLLRNAHEKWIILILHAERIAPSHETGRSLPQESIPFSEIMHTLALDDGIAAGMSRMVLVTFSGMTEDLIVRSRGFRLIEVGLPCLEERKAFIEFLDKMAKNGCSEFGDLDASMSMDDLARLTSGMPLSAIELAYRVSGYLKKSVSQEQIRLDKARTIRNLARDLMDVSEPQEGFESVAGLSGIKSYFKELIPQIKAGRPGVPQAFLLQGVPGCGKSHLVKALSKELGWPLLELRNVRNPFVGQSEMNMEHVIRIVEQLQPAILFFDEIDQSLGQRGTGASGDSGTSERLLARVFTWLGSLHLRGKLLFIGATNRPDILDPALLDRFGVSIPFLKPATEELRELIPMTLKRFQRNLVDIDAEETARIFTPLAPTGRCIQEILVNAGLYADLENNKIGNELQKRHLIKASQDHISREDDLELEFIALMSLSLCSLQSLLPWNDFSGRRSGVEIPQNFLESGVVSPDGILDKNRLHEAISSIKQRRHTQRMMR